MDMGSKDHSYLVFIEESIELFCDFFIFETMSELVGACLRIIKRNMHENETIPIGL